MWNKTKHNKPWSEQLTFWQWRKNKPQPSFCGLNWEPASLFELSTVCLYETNSNFTLSAAFSAFPPLMGLNEALRTPTSYQGDSVSGDTARGLLTQNAPWRYPRPALELPLTVKFAYIPRLLHPHPYMPLGPRVRLMGSYSLGVAGLEVSPANSLLLEVMVPSAWD